MYDKFGINGDCPAASQALLTHNKQTEKFKNLPVKQTLPRCMLDSLLKYDKRICAVGELFDFSYSL